MKYVNVYSNEKTFDVGLRDYMYLVYKQMGLALLISGIVAFIVANTPVLLSIFFSNQIIALIVQLAPIFYVFTFGRNIMALSVQQAKNKLYIFAVLMGISLSTIFLVYTGSSIVETFLTTAITFGCMSIYGYTTKRDLTRLGSFLTMGILGLCIASLINLFVKSPGFSYALSCIGVLVFTVYTAYNVQELKNVYDYAKTSGTDVVEKMAIFGALDLYITFINLFTSLLALFGSRRE